MAKKSRHAGSVLGANISRNHRLACQEAAKTSLLQDINLVVLCVSGLGHFEMRIKTNIYIYPQVPKVGTKIGKLLPMVICELCGS